MGLFGKKNKPESTEKQTWLSKLSEGLSKTKQSISGKLDQLVLHYKKLDDEFFEELEAVLVSADIGISASQEILNDLRTFVKENKITETSMIRDALRESICRILEADKSNEDSFPMVILICGVNGSGKTTAIGKLSDFYRKQGKTVMVAAADTFRAAAAEQLIEWSKRAGASIVVGAEGSDPSAVVFDAVASAKAKKIDVLICDTAGRLHNKKNLMDELAKINRVISRECPEFFRRNVIVLDASAGQNSIVQVKAFYEAVGIDGIIINKLDGTAKGGAVIAIAKEMHIPILFVGIGEGIDDLRPFVAQDFVSNIL